MHICMCTCIMNWSLRSRKCLRNFEFKWVQERFLIGQVLGSKEMYRNFCPKMYQEMFLKPWHFLLPKTFRKFHILGIFPGLGNFIFLPVEQEVVVLHCFTLVPPVVLCLFGGYLLDQALIWLLSSRVWSVVCRFSSCAVSKHAPYSLRVWKDVVAALYTNMCCSF